MCQGNTGGFQAFQWIHSCPLAGVGYAACGIAASKRIGRAQVAMSWPNATITADEPLHNRGFATAGGDVNHNQIICGDSRTALQGMADAFIDTIVTSPPYFRQRNYDPRQLGMEKSAAAYVESLVEVFRECARLLRDDGTLWLNIGDKYQEGRLLGIPWRVALALVDAGWQLRSDIIWHKPNAMPHSVKTRPTTDHEYIFLFSRSRQYYYDADAIREPHVTFTNKSKMRGGRNHFGRRGGTPEEGKNEGNSNLHDSRWDQAFHPKGRNKRTVWSVPLGKFRGSHFAVFPPSLIEPCILAGSRKGGIVLDPFFGAGTVGLVAARLGRKYIGVELNKDYVDLARTRLGEVQMALIK